MHGCFEAGIKNKEKTKKEHHPWQPPQELRWPNKGSVSSLVAVIVLSVRPLPTSQSRSA